MSVVQVPELFSSVFGLGGAIEVYPLKKANRIGNIVGMIIFFGGAALAFLYGIYNTYIRWQKFGSAVILKSITGPLMIAFVLFLLGLLVIWSFYSNAKKAAVLYENGVAYSDRKGMRAWRWDEINSMTVAVTKHYTNGIYTGTTHVYTLIKKDGEKFVLNDTIADVEQLAGKIGEKIYPLLYHEYADAFNAGKPLLFGPVKISKAGGIQIGKKQYSWSEIAEVGIRKGILSVKKKDGGWFSGATAMASAIPNLQVLLAIIHQVVGLKTG
jgi:hypothetical protein